MLTIYTYSGSNAIVTWIAVPGAVTYTFGGYYSCGGGFVVCSTTNSATIFRSCGGTFRITANCDGNSSCGNVTCGGSPSSPGTF